MIDTLTDSFVERLRGLGVKGETGDERAVRDLEQQLRVELPPAYKAFLIVAGNGWEPLEGSHYAIEDDLANLQRSGQRIMRHDGAKLPDDAFVLLVHQGYAFSFFLVHDGEDPPVYEYAEGMPPVRCVAPRFTDWLADVLSRSRALREQRTSGA
jgi:SMI1-KNR4 cell-wall